jgi:hypothetical protein
MTSVLFLFHFPRTSDAQPLPMQSEARLNGIVLAIRTDIGEESGSHVLTIKWRLKYIGKRLPCTILKPSLKIASSGATVVSVFASPGGDGNEVVLPFESPPLRNEDPAKVLPVDGSPFGNMRTNLFPESFFISLDANSCFEEALEIKLSHLRELLDKRAPGVFRDVAPQRIRVAISHNSYDRGERYNLDAWTGKIIAGPLSIPNTTK